jgi:hypothetical protein
MNLSQATIFRIFRTYPYAGPLFLGSVHQLQHPQPEQQQYSNLRVYIYYRLYLTRRHARRLAPHAPSRCRLICSGAPALETGKVLTTLVRSVLPFR